MKNLKVLVVATSRKTRGGITSVIKAHETGEQWKKYHCHWVQTHRDGPAWRKIVYLIIAWIDFMIHLPFYHIIHIHLSLQTTAFRKRYFVKVAKIFRKKVIIHLHCGTQIDEIWNKDYDYLFTTADVCLFLSKSLMDCAAKHVGKRDFRICYNPCPNVLPVPHVQKQNIILFSGTLYPGKGYIDLIEAFSMIAFKYLDWKLVFAGNGEIEKAKQLAKKMHIEHQTVFLGWISGEVKDDLFRKSTIFCLPSYAEGFPMAVLDAWAYALPVITTPVGGIPDIAKNGENMLLFNPGDVKTLASQIERMIVDSGLRERIAKASHHLAISTFNVNTINRFLGDLYEELSLK